MYITKHDTDNMNQQSYTALTLENKLSFQYLVFKLYNC